MGDEDIDYLLEKIIDQSIVLDKLITAVHDMEASQESIKGAITDLSIAYLRLSENVKTTTISGKMPNCS